MLANALLVESQSPSKQRRLNAIKIEPDRTAIHLLSPAIGKDAIRKSKCDNPAERRTSVSVYFHAYTSKVPVDESRQSPVDHSVEESLRLWRNAAFGVAICVMQQAKAGNRHQFPQQICDRDNVVLALQTLEEFQDRCRPQLDQFELEAFYRYALLRK